jgi:hypothetical protein
MGIRRWHNEYFLFVWLLLFCRLPLNAQTGNDSTTQSTDSIVQDTDSTYKISSIVLIGNKITKERIIYRELTFHLGDTIKESEFNFYFHRSEENLQNTSLFNSVKITWLKEKSNLNIYIVVTERWYIFPLPIFEIAERNFNVWWQDKDYSRIIYGGVLTWNNFRGRNEVLAVSARLGYTQRLSFYYNIPSINKKQNTGLTFGFAYSRNHQSSVQTVNNKILYYKDENLFSKKEYGVSVAYSHRSTLYETHTIETGFKHATVLDTVISLNQDYFVTGESSIDYPVLRYFFKSDHRDIVVYPLKGYYFDAEIVKNGSKLLNSDIDLFYITTHFKKFWPLTNRFHFGTGLSVKYSGESFYPYYLTRGLGYGRDYLRGYEYYVMDGQHFALFKSNLKFTLLPKHELHADFIPLNKFSTIPYAFYLNLYGDAGYVKDRQFEKLNPLVNSWQYSYGAGIDFVTYYDMVFRFEYSFNKLGESGFFLHFTASI